MNWTGKPNVTEAPGKNISREDHHNIAFANFKAHKFSYLNITSLNTNYVVNEDECSFACVDIPSCFSYNLAAFSDISGRILCELLPSDKYNNSDKFIGSQIFTHFSIWVSTSLSKLLFSRSREISDPILCKTMFNVNVNVINIYYKALKPRLPVSFLFVFFFVKQIPSAQENLITEYSPTKSALSFSKKLPEIEGLTWREEDIKF